MKYTREVYQVPEGEAGEVYQVQARRVYQVPDAGTRHSFELRGFELGSTQVPESGTWYISHISHNSALKRTWYTQPQQPLKRTWYTQPQQPLKRTWYMQPYSALTRWRARAKCFRPSAISSYHQMRGPLCGMLADGSG